MSDYTNDMPKKRRMKYSDAHIIAALKATNGGVYLAAARLGCEPKTIYSRADKSPKIQATIEQARGELVDMAEAGLKKKVLDGDTTAMIWVTKTLGRGRGYVERTEHEISGRNGAPIQITAVDYRTAIVDLAPTEDGSVGDSDAPGKD